MVIRSRSAREDGSSHTTITMASRVGRRVMNPVSTEFVSDDGTLDASSMVEIWRRWQRRFMRDEQAVKQDRKSTRLNSSHRL